VALVLSARAECRCIGNVAFACSHNQVGYARLHFDVASFTRACLAFGVITETVLPAQFISDGREELRQVGEIIGSINTAARLFRQGLQIVCTDAIILDPRNKAGSGLRFCDSVVSAILTTRSC
jgi:hypothetical protein